MKNSSFQNARVLVVDDSPAMRALFADVLDQTKNVSVIGTAANADEARDQIARLQPNVVTLDVEMPGMSGIEFLEEIMATNPLPVVMLSTLTQSGTETSLRAFELGAVDCFPKPLKVTPEQFGKTVGKLGKIVLAAANSNLGGKARAGRSQRAENAQFEWNGHLAALSASMGGIDALSALLGQFPRNCPPAVIVLKTELPVARAFIARLAKELKCAVREAVDGALLVQGTVHIATDPSRHVVVEPGQPPRLRLMARDPVDGTRPSADLLFGSIARGGVPTVGVVLTGSGEDGARGLKLMREAGCRTIAQSPASALVPQAPAAALAMGAAEFEHPLDDLPTALLSCCGTS